MGLLYFIKKMKLLTIFLAFIGASAQDPTKDPCFGECGLIKNQCASKCRAEQCPPHLGSTELTCKTCMHECEKAVINCKCDCPGADPTWTTFSLNKTKF